MTANNQIVVIGAGVGGMMAAGRAAELGAQVLLLEKMERPGKKILVSGNGGCNLTNSRDLDSFIAQFGENGPFLNKAFSRFFRNELLAFLHRYGIETKTEPNGKIYPASDNARDIVRLLKHYLDDGKVQLETGVAVSSILTENRRVVGVQTPAGETPASAVILAAGGSAHPETGSSGDGFRIASQLGHAIVPLRPALVPLIATQFERRSVISSASLRNVKATAFQCTADKIDTSLIPISDAGRGIPGKQPVPPIIESRTGDAIITHFGLSGPVVLEMSLSIIDALANGPVSVSFDLKPGAGERELRADLDQIFDLFAKRTCKDILHRLLPHKLVEPFLTLTSVPAERPGGDVSSEDRERLLRLMKSLRFDVKGPYSMSTAMVTAGGVSLSEIDSRNMSSTLVAGLYFCGEVMDLDAGTGGYNLQAAFSTGYVAGESAASFVFKGY